MWCSLPDTVALKLWNIQEALSIDEHYFPNSDSDGLFMFIMMDFKTGEFIDIYPDRRKNYLTSKFSAIKNRTYNDKMNIPV